MCNDAVSWSVLIQDLSGMALFQEADVIRLA